MQRDRRTHRVGGAEGESDAITIRERILIPLYSTTSLRGPWLRVDGDGDGRREGGAEVDGVLREHRLLERVTVFCRLVSPEKCL